PGASVWEVGFGDANGQVIYAPTDKGLYKTVDRGRTWSKILAYSGATDFFSDRPSFAVDPSNYHLLLLPVRSLWVMRSSDGGSNWVRVDDWVNAGSASGNPTILSWSTGNPSYVYAEAETNNSNTQLTIHVSQDGGVTWSTKASTTAFNQGMYDMAI